MDYDLEDDINDIAMGLNLDLEMLRENLIDELHAVNQYQQQIDSLDNEDTISVLENIIRDEKGHVAKLVKLIQRLDPVQAEEFRKEIL